MSTPFNSEWLKPGAAVEVNMDTITAYHNEVLRLRAALAEPVQEPVKVLRTLVQIHADGTETWREDPVWSAPPQRKPLAEWQINDLMADIDPEDVCSWSFRQGVYAAEKHHGVRP